MFNQDNIINIEDSPEAVKKQPSCGEIEVVKNILSAAGLTYEPAVLNQLLYMTYSHVTNILEDAITVSQHADKSALDSKDVKLAIKMNRDKRPFNRNKRQDALNLAQEVNTVPLPEISSTSGLRLPPEKYCLLSSKYSLKRVEKPQEHPHFYSYSHPNQLASVLLHPSSVSQAQEMYGRTLLKRPQKMQNVPQKIVFRPNISFNPNNMDQQLKRKRDNN